MRGHIVQRAKNKGTWSIVIELNKDAIGKRRQKWITFQGSRAQAEKRLTELLHQLDTGSYIQPGKTTLAEYLTRWLISAAVIWEVLLIASMTLKPGCRDAESGAK